MPVAPRGNKEADLIFKKIMSDKNIINEKSKRKSKREKNDEKTRLQFKT